MPVFRTRGPRRLRGGTDGRGRANRQENVMNRTLILVAATAAAALSGVSAYAGCADPRNSEAFHQTPPISLPLSAGINRAHTSDAATNIVGTWLVTYTVEG